MLIDDSPKMPELSFKIKDKKYFGDCWSSFFVHLEITYERYQKYGRSRNDKVIIEQTSLLKPDLKLNFRYNIKYEMEDIHGWNTDIMGGRASLILFYQGTPIDTFKFSIKGKNPVVNQVFNFCNKLHYKPFWFLKNMIVIESGSVNSLSDTILQFVQYNASVEDLWKSWDQDTSRCPLTPQNRDGGFGLCQLTILANGLPNKHDLWDWKCNINTAYSELLIKKQTVRKKFNDYDWSILKNWNYNNPEDKIDPIVVNYEGKTWKMAQSAAYGSDDSDVNTYFTETLSQNELSVLDACIMAAYNGLNKINGVHRNFIYMTEAVYDQNNGNIVTKPKWNFKDSQYNYIKKFSHTKIP